MRKFDKRLSLAIDAIHDKLDEIADARGVLVWLRRWWLKRTLRGLERQIPG